MRTYSIENRLGRPPLPKGQGKEHRLQIRCTFADMELICFAANKAKQPATTWAREQLLRLAREVLDH